MSPRSHFDTGAMSIYSRLPDEVLSTIYDFTAKPSCFPVKWLVQHGACEGERLRSADGTELRITSGFSPGSKPVCQRKCIQLLHGAIYSEHGTAVGQDCACRSPFSVSYTHLTLPTKRIV